MATAVKRKLSGSTDGRGIKVVQTGTPGTAIHTPVAGTTAGTFDEIWLYAYNGHTADVTLTIEFGGTGVPDDNVVMTIPYKQGAFLVVPGWILQNGTSAYIKAFASVANVAVIFGYINSITD